MSDIDFDELDRAVSGALGGTTAPANKPVEQSVVETPALESSVKNTPYEVPTIEHIERTQLDPTVAKPPIASAPASRRSSGRFMDMVHPSSDMRTPGVTQPTPTRFSTPFTPSPVPPFASAPASIAEPEVIATLEPVIAAPAWNEPLESPFLPDTKVEKRPLGGVTIDQAPLMDAFDFQGLLDEPDEELLEAPEPQERIEATTTPDPIDFVESENADFEEEALPIADAPEEFAQIEEPAVSEDAMDHEIPEAPTEVELIPEQPQPTAAAPQPFVEQPTGPTSITPQYQEQPSSNQESGAIYDTESYHQAVVAPIQKRSGWVTLIWIVILILLGAAAGWAVYTYILPMIG